MSSKTATRKLIITPATSSKLQPTVDRPYFVEVPENVSEAEVLDQILEGTQASLEKGRTSVAVLGAEFKVADFARVDTENSRIVYPDALRFKIRKYASYVFLAPEILEPTAWLRKRLQDLRKVHADEVDKVLGMFSEFGGSPQT